MLGLTVLATKYWGWSQGHILACKFDLKQAYSLHISNSLCTKTWLLVMPKHCISNMAKFEEQALCTPYGYKVTSGMQHSHLCPQASINISRPWQLVFAQQVVRVCERLRQPELKQMLAELFLPEAVQRVCPRCMHEPSPPHSPQASS